MITVSGFLFSELFYAVTQIMCCNAITWFVFYFYYFSSFFLARITVFFHYSVYFCRIRWVIIVAEKVSGIGDLSTCPHTLDRGGSVDYSFGHTFLV